MLSFLLKSLATSYARRRRRRRRCCRCCRRRRRCCCSVIAAALVVVAVVVIVIAVFLTRVVSFAAGALPLSSKRSDRVLVNE